MQQTQQTFSRPLARNNGTTRRIRTVGQIQENLPPEVLEQKCKCLGGEASVSMAKKRRKKSELPRNLFKKNAKLDPTAIRALREVFRRADGSASQCFVKSS